jgi:hypothetical protein
MSWRADRGKDVICRRCLVPGRGFGEWWTDELLERVGGIVAKAASP